MDKKADWRDPLIPGKIELPLDIAVSDLKRYKREMPYNLYSLTSVQVNYLKRMFGIIEGMEIPEKMTSE